MRIKSIVSESRQIQRAIALIKLGARLQVLESETDLSYERLLRLYKEVQGESPARGMLPFSTDWFMTWQPNIHSSLFLNIYEYLDKSSELEEIDAIIKAYELYLELLIEDGGRALVMRPLLNYTDGNLDAVVTRAREAGVAQIIIPATNLQTLADARAIAYVQIKPAAGGVKWGVGVDTNIELASIQAVLSALNRFMANFHDAPDRRSNSGAVAGDADRADGAQRDEPRTVSQALRIHCD